ncbi:MAG TPA: hypothetical protein VIW70_12475 [Rubrivivax sp.]
MPFRSTPLAAAVLLLAACAPALDWREIRPDASGVTLMLPCRPSSHARDVILAGAPARLTLYACNASGMTWALAYVNLEDPSRVRAALRELRAAAAANLGAGTELPFDWVLAGATPHADSGRFELRGHLPGGKAVREQVAVYARGTTVYQATVVGEVLDPEAVEVFFAGLRLLP